MKARQAIKEILNEIPEDRLEEALSYLNYLRFREEWEATEEILRDKKLMQSWRRGKLQAELPTPSRPLLHNLRRHSGA